jgi:hypothetical protein
MQFGTTITGKPSAKINSKGVKGWRTYLRIKMIAIYESQLYSDTEISFALRITPQYVRMLKQTPEYVAAKMSAATNVLSQAEKDALASVQSRREAMDDLVPEALQAIRDTIINGVNPTLRLKAAQDLLDRQGDLAKISRTEVSIPTKINYDEHDRRANDLLSALASINAPVQKDAQETEKDTQIAGVEEFTNTSLNAEQQKKIQDAMKLITEAAAKDNGTQLIN